MSNPNENNNERDLENKLLSDIKSRVDNSELKDKSIKVYVGKKKVLDGVIGDLSLENKLTPESLKQLEIALYSPEKLEGSVRISDASKKELYRVANGIRSRDELNISSLIDQTQSESISQDSQIQDSQKSQSAENIQKSDEVNQVEVESTQQEQTVEIIELIEQNLQKAQSPEMIEESNQSTQLQSTEPNVISKELEISNSLKRINNQINSFEQQLQKINSRESLTVQPEETLKSINNLQETIQKQQEVINRLVQASQDIINSKSTVESSPVINPENSALQNFVGDIERKVKETVQGILNQIKQFIQPKLDAVKSKVDNFKNQVQQRINAVTNKIDDTREAIETNVEKAVNTVVSNVLEAKGKAIEASVGTMLKIAGKKQEDNSITYSTKNYDFRLQGDSISMMRKSDGKAIVDEGVVTQEATQKDLQNIEKLELASQKYVYEVAQEQPQQQDNLVEQSQQQDNLAMSLAQDVASMIRIKYNEDGIEINDDNLYSYQHNDYKFDIDLTSNENPITISLAEDNNIKIFTNGKFTDNASTEDIKGISSIRNIMQEHNENLASEQQLQQSRGMGR